SDATTTEAPTTTDSRPGRDEPADEPPVTQRATTTRQPTTTTTEPPFGPLPFSGTGDFVITLDEPLSEPVVARVSHTGGSNFVVETLDASGQSVDLLVNEIGAYTGVRPVNFRDGESVSLIQITADGAWTLSLEDVETLRAADTAPAARIDGTGDD